jgi:hypothetical protein
MKRLTALLILCMLLGLDAYAGPPTIINSGSAGILTDSNCDQAKYYSIGTLCQDTDDGKLYKGTGSGVEEIAAASLTAASEAEVAAGTVENKYVNPKELKTVTDGKQAANADLSTIASGGSANCLWGEKSDSSGIECKSTINIQLDDSAAQFKSATASKGTLKFDQTGVSDTKTVTVKYTATDNYTLTPTVTGNAAYSIGATEWNLNALNLVTTGTVSGRIPMVPDADGRNIATTEISGHVHLATGTGTWLLPAMAAANGTGWSMCIYSTTNDDVVFDVDVSDKFRYDGALKTAGKSLTISDAGAFICAVLTDYDSDIAHWTIFGTAKTITAEAD